MRKKRLDPQYVNTQVHNYVNSIGLLAEMNELLEESECNIYCNGTHLHAVKLTVPVDTFRIFLEEEVKELNIKIDEYEQNFAAYLDKDVEE